MRGIILEYDSHLNTGAISGEDGARYTFGRPDWQGGALPVAGQEVEFTADGETAANITPSQEPMPPFSWKWFLFSLNGRIGRKSYWLRWVLPAFAIVVLAGAATTVSASPRLAALAAKMKDLRIGDSKLPIMLEFFRIYAPFYLLGAILFWPSITTQVKRLHDRNRSGKILLLYFLLYLLRSAARFAGADNIAKEDTLFAALWVLYGILMFIFVLWLLIETLFLRGTQGPNRYGAVTR